MSCAVITVSDTRTAKTDTGGDLLVGLLTEGGHELTERRIVRDDPREIRPLLDEFIADSAVEVILMTGGTGIARRDLTFETVSELICKPIPGYGELFRLLSFQEIGAAAMLSRAVGGVAQSTVLLTMPGSPAAIRLAMQQLILPQLGHLVREATK